MSAKSASTSTLTPAQKIQKARELAAERQAKAKTQAAEAQATRDATRKAAFEFLPAGFPETLSVLVNDQVFTAHAMIFNSGNVGYNICAKLEVEDKDGNVHRMQFNSNIVLIAK